jgi:hypothetical protein
VARRHAVAAMSALGYVAFLTCPVMVRGWEESGYLCHTLRARTRSRPLTPSAQAFTYLGALVACALLPACSPSAGVTPTPTPAVSTPAGQSTPPETEQQRKERLDFEAAEKAYRTFRAEYDRISDTRGGSAKPTKVMTDNAAGPYLKVMSAFLRSKKEKGSV